MELVSPGPYTDYTIRLFIICIVELRDFLSVQSMSRDCVYFHLFPNGFVLLQSVPFNFLNVQFFTL